MASRSVKIEWPDSIVAERHELTGRWVLWYLDDNQAMACHNALKKPKKQEQPE